jgi:hypothetical protein
MAAYREIARDPYLSAMMGDRGGRPNPNPSPSPSPSPSPNPAVVSLSNTLDGGSVGSTVAAGGSQGAGRDPFDRVEIDRGASLTYDRTHPRNPGVTARHVVGPHRNAFYGWHRSIEGWSDWNGRLYFWIGSLPSGPLRVVRSRDASGPNFGIDLGSDGTLRISDARNRTVASTRSAIRTDAWIRIEWRVNHETGRAELRLFNRQDSTTPTETVSSGAGMRFSRAAAVVQIGRSGRQSSSATFWTDDPALSSSGWIGTAT